MERINISRFGIKPDTGEMLTKEIQFAINESAQKNQQLVFPKGNYMIGTLILEDNTNIYLEEGAVLYGSGNIEDYLKTDCTFIDAVGQERGKTLLLSYRKKNITIAGLGVVSGNGALFSGNKPFLIRIIESENVTFDHVTLKDAAAWCLHIDRSAYVDIKNVTIDTRVNENNDGIDIDASRYINIQGCKIYSGDDALCMKATTEATCEHITISDCEVSSGWAGFKIGTESVGDIQNIEVKNCLFRNVKGGAIKIVPTDGSNVKNVLIKDIKLENCTGPIFIVLGERLRKYAGIGRETLSTMENIIIENIEGSVCAAPIRGIAFDEIWGNAIGGIILSGTKKNYIHNLTIKNVKLNLSGGIEAYQDHEVPYIGDKYPEFHRMDIVPAKGLYVRNVDNLHAEDIELSFDSKDIRELIVTEECNHIVIKDVKEVK